MKLKVSSAAKQAATVLCSLACLAGNASTATAASATASGSSALALAAVVASHGSVLGAFDKRAMSRFFGGNPNLIIQRVNKINVSADSVACTMSNVDITMRSCDLVFKTHKVKLSGRDANEVYGTLAVAGVASEGAAGSSSVSITNLACSIDPTAIKAKAGDGASCTFDTGK